MATSDEFVLCSLPNKRPSSSSRPYFDYLPIELLIDIIQRLPQDVIHRCMCISKRWKKLISSDDFIKYYIQYNTCLANSRPPFAFFFKYCMTNPFGFGTCALGRLQFAFSENKALFKISGFGFYFFPFDLSAPNINVLSSSNGLVLCSPFSHFPGSFQDEPVYYVCNPLTKKWFRLENGLSSDDLFTRYSDPSSTPIGFLSKSTNSGCSFRVVRVLHTYIPKNYLRFQIYNSELRQWRELVFEKLPYDLYFSMTSKETFDGEAIACNGLLHWVNKRGDIFVYDPYCGTNKYVITSLPNKCYPGRMKPTIGVCKGRLRYLERRLEKYVVWELEDYDTHKWSLVHEFCLNQMDIGSYRSDHKDSSPFAFHPFDEDVVFLQLSGSWLIVSCDMRKKKLLKVCKIDPKRKVCISPIILPWWPVPLSQN